MRRRGGLLLAAALLAAAPLSLAAQAPEARPAQDSTRSPRRREAAVVFRSDSLLDVTIRTDLRTLFASRDTTNAPWQPGTISWRGPDSVRTAPLELRTRGNYRLRECEIPPIRLRFTDSLLRGTPWRNARHPKLVSACFDRDNYEQYVLGEYAIYRVLRLFTPLSLTARLLRVTYEDAGGRRRPITRYAFLTEDPERFGERLGGTMMAPTVGSPLGRLSPSYVALLGVFQYFIANTDWSVPGHHNIQLFRMADTTFGIPYDFDWAGVINAPYARPAPQLPIRNVRERIYRGFCQPESVLEPVLARFEALRDSVAAVYHGLPGLAPRTLDETLRYYDEFYRTIADRPRFFERVVGRDCQR